MGFFSNILQSAQSITDPDSIIGVDIGGSSIKVVELAERDGVLTLVTYGEVQLGPYASKPLGSVVHLTPKQEQEALVDVVRESAVKSREAVFAMPLASSFISTSTIQADPDVDLSSMVRVEARKLIPASLNEVTLDWAELELTNKKTGRTVLIAAIQNSAVERFKVLMQFAGFGQSPTEIECFSANRSVGKMDNTVVIDFGASSTKMYLSHEGVLNRMQRTNIGGAAVTYKLAEANAVDFEVAEDQKLQTTSGDAMYEQLYGIYTKQYSRALREFRQVLDSYQQDAGITFDHIKICGGASTFAGLPKMVGDAFQLDVEYIDPFKSVAYPAFMEDTMKAIGPLFVPSLGAALRGFE